MVRSTNHPGPLDPRWELVETRNATGRMLYARRPRVGARFGPLTVLRSDAANSGYAECVCECGTPKRINVGQLWNSRSLRCKACFSAELTARLRKDHDIIPDDKLRKAWADRYKHLVRRCTNPLDPAYANYGGRGITVCAEWVSDRRAFFQHVKTLDNWDAPGLDLDREHNDRGYEPGNIRLTTRRVNSNNTRRTTRVSYCGVEMPLSTFWRKHCPQYKTRNTIRYYLDTGRTTEWIVEKHNATRGSVRPPELRSEESVHDSDKRRPRGRT